MKYVVFLVLFLAACTPVADVSQGIPAWMNAPLTDANTGEIYRISEFEQPIFFEAFATWCPSCVRQQKEIKRFKETNPDVVSVSLSIDPTDSEDILRAYSTEHEFDWRFSMSSPELTQELIDTYGSTIVNAPLVPVLLICPDKTTHLLTNGVKDVDDLHVSLELCAGTQPVVAPPRVEGKTQTLADGTKYVVHPDNILAGGPPRDGIPSIDEPKYVSVAEADEWIQDDELVLAIIYDDVKRVYPLQILVWHEIVNDYINDQPLLITYCPLCGSGIAYERTLDGEPVEFGTSGKLYNSNLVMYDRKTETYWTQIDGLAILGERTGEELVPVSIDTVVWRDWKANHPDSQVLSQDTGHERDYGRDPYGSYYEDSNLFFPVEHRDDRIHPKDVVFGVELNGDSRAYRETDLLEGDIKDVLAGVPVMVTRDAAGVVKITRQDNNEEIIKERDFWFAWYAFHPETSVYGLEANPR